MNIEEKRIVKSIIEDFIRGNNDYVWEEYEKTLTNKAYVEWIMESVGVPAIRGEGIDDKRVHDFSEKLKNTQLQISFLQTVLSYLEARWKGGPQFEDYEHAIGYLCVAAAGMEKLVSLPKRKKAAFFQYMLTGIQYAGEPGQIGRAFGGKWMIQTFVPFLTVSLVKEIVSRNFYMDADFISKVVSNENMRFFVESSNINFIEKRKYEEIDLWFVRKTNESLGNLVDTIQSMLPYYKITQFTKEKWAKKQEIIELLYEPAERRVYVWGELKVWEERIEYTIGWDGSGNERMKTYKLHYKMESGTSEGKWMEPAGAGKSAHIMLEYADFGQVEDTLTQRLMKYLDMIGEKLPQQENDLEIVCFWHSSLYDGKVKEKMVDVQNELCCHVTCDDLGCYLIKITKKESDARLKYWIEREAAPAVKSLTILLGKNGSGKTSTMKMLRFDGVEQREKAPGKYFIVYKRRGEYFYSTNLQDKEYELTGSVLQKGEENISSYRRQKNRLVYFSNVILPYEEERDRFSTNMVNLSSQYIRDYEINGTIENENYICMPNQDVRRQLQFLYDRYDVELQEKEEEKLCEDSESRKINYVKKYVLVRYRKEFQKIMAMLDEKKISSQLIREGYEGYEWQITYGSKEELGNLIDFLQEIMGDADSKGFRVMLPPMSSGEHARLTMFARLHDWIRGLTNVERAQNSVLLLDEVEAFMHPEWQRTLIFDLISFLEWENSVGNFIQVQLFISSNSPFLISDVEAEAITILDESIQMPEKTFGQNIHTILKESFFMERGTMGEFAKLKIDRLYQYLLGRMENKEAGEPDKAKERDGETIKNMIDKIGEPLLEADLRGLYDEVFGEKAEESLLEENWTDEQLEEVIKKAQEELARRRR